MVVHNVALAVVIHPVAAVVVLQAVALVAVRPVVIGDIFFNNLFIFCF